MNIKTEYQRLVKRRVKLNADIGALQALCTHPDAEHVNHASTGNYDPSADSYWTDHKCPDCGKCWMTDQYWDRK